MFHPQVLASEWCQTGDINTLVLRNAVLDQVTEHSGLAPLGAIEAWWKGKMFSLKSDIIQTTWKSEMYNCQYNRFNLLTIFQKQTNKQNFIHKKKVNIPSL